MDETQPDNPVPENAEASSRAEASGMEINLGDFTRTQGLMKSLRLLLNDQIVVPVEELASGITDAGRKFKIGEIEQANQDVARLYSAFGQKTSQWESQARSLEQQMKMQAAKNPKSISIEKMNRMKAEQTAVRTRIRTADVHFRRLHQGLDLAFTNLQRQSSPARKEPPAALPAGFLAAFKAAAPENRAAIVRDSFDAGTVLQVRVSRSATEGYEIRFDPLPPLNRLYYLAKKTQVIRLEQLGDPVIAQNVETGQKSEMPLVEFVKEVQSGVWLLESRTAARQGNS